MATTPIQPGKSDGYQINYLPDGSLLVTQFETLAANDVIEWDDEFATGGGTGWSHDFIGVANANIAKINGIAIANIGKVNGVE